jgi:hypothetical protein
MAHKPDKLPLVAYFSIVAVSTPLVTVLLLWLPSVLGYDLGGGGIDQTSAYSMYVFLVGSAVTLIAICAAVISGVHHLLKH